MRGRLLAREGHQDAARREAERAVSLRRESDSRTDLADALDDLASVLIRLGDRAGAMAAWREARDLLEEKGAVAMVAAPKKSLASCRGGYYTLPPEAMLP